MNKWYLIVVVAMIISCSEKVSAPTAQEIVDKSIAVSGGEKYTTTNVSFRFRDIDYSAEGAANNRILKRTFKRDSAQITDVRSSRGLERFIDGNLMVLSDSVANLYANSINSVHYFAYLPYGLNDAAVKKKFLGKVKIDTVDYYKIEVSFDEDGGGDDHDDIYMYWFNTKTFKPDYLAYQFHINGGGQRFRKAFNEREIGGIRFVDYQNYKNTQLEYPLHQIDSLFNSNTLDLLSEIKLENIKVTPGNYN